MGNRKKRNKKTERTGDESCRQKQCEHTCLPQITTPTPSDSLQVAASRSTADVRLGPFCLSLRIGDPLWPLMIEN